jgi:pyruvate kinase
MRHTRIVATLGPASDTPDAIADLVAAGVDVFRLNFSHGSRDAHGVRIARVREAARRAGREVAVLQDLAGPKIRTGPLQHGQPVVLAAGATVRIAPGDFAGTAERLSTTFAGLARSVSAGDRLLLDDGRIELRVEATDGAEIVATVVVPGTLGEHKGINAPGVPLPASSLTDRDRDDLRFGLAHGVDAAAVSFVRSAADLEHARAAAAALGAPALPLFAKIERPEALGDLDAVLDACDGVMVARGDLGLELPFEQVPRIQKEITRAARARGLPVIVATQVLESMRTEARPTRAEVSDAANAVDDGVDGIMLAGETAVGAWPARVVRTLDAIAREAERIGPTLSVPVDRRVVAPAHSRALAEATATLVASGAARAIVAVTRQGKTARVLSAFRPPVPIFAATSDPAVARRLVFHRGVTPVVVELGPTVEETEAAVERALVDRGLLAAGDPIAFVSVSAEIGPGGTNFVRLMRVGGGR